MKEFIKMSLHSRDRRSHRFSRGWLALIFGMVGGASALFGADPARVPEPLPLRDISFANEVQHAIDRGLRALLSRQNSNGWWSTPDHVAPTALALSALMGEPTGRFRREEARSLTRGYAFVLESMKPDGSIYRTSLINYNTSISLMALLAANNPAYHEAILRGRGFLVKSQTDQNESGRLDSPFDGGVGYGDKYAHSDLNNTLTALEALYYSRGLATDKPASERRDLNWPAVVHFIQNCQNLPSHNRETWASDDPGNRGGFVYYPGHSMAGTRTNAATGRVALRSYGSISYAGLLSYIYADLQREDPRVVAVLDWLRGNYTLEENPGMEQQGLYYYLHLMTKALNLLGAETLVLKDGRRIPWRRDLAMRLINLQQGDGSWSNTSGRWWEKDPNLVTAYAVLSLDIIHRGMPGQP